MTDSRILDAEVLARIDAHLAEMDERLASNYPPPDGVRQPVHTVYVPADDPRAGQAVAPAWGRAALDLVEEHGGLEQVCRELDLPEPLTAQVAPRVLRKLTEEPVEDLRIDFEDGYSHGGSPGDDARHDTDVVRAVAQRRSDERAGVATEFWGIRFPCFEADTRARGLRTLDLTVGELVRTGGLPDGLRLTFPKVSTATQVEALVLALTELERGHGLLPGQLSFEIQVEVPQLVLGADGSAELSRAVRAGQGRVTGLHYGTYDYSAAMQVAAAHQALDHPVADHAKAVMQVVVAGTPVQLSDGSTNVTPTGDRAQRTAAWALHHRLVSRSLRQGIYQGWDMHPGHLVSRYVATYAFFRLGLPAALDRLGRYARQASGEVVDEPATVRALAAYLRRGLACGAIDPHEVQATTGLDEGAVIDLSQARSDTAALVRRAGAPHTQPHAQPHAEPHTQDPSAAGEAQP